MKHVKTFRMFERTAAEIPHTKNKWVEIEPGDYKDVEDDFFKLINTAYAEIGGHVKVKNPEDLYSQGWNYWTAVDVDADPDFEAFKAAEITPFGKKSVAAGHDGSKEAKRAYLGQTADDMGKPGNYIEASGKFSEILMNKYGVHVVEDEDTVKKVLGEKSKEMTWHGKHPTSDMPGEGWYTRKIGGANHTKIMLGRPKGPGVNESKAERRPKVLFIHGLNGVVVQDRLDIMESLGMDVVYPHIVYQKEAKTAFDRMCKIIEGDNFDAVAGTSMGGLFSNYLSNKYRIPALLFNPAMMSKTVDKIGVTIDKGDKAYSNKILVLGALDDTILPSDTKRVMKKGVDYDELHMEPELEHRIPPDIFEKYMRILKERIS